jgi:hypothetical protein
MLFGVNDDGAITGLDGDLAEQRRRLRTVLIAEVSPSDGTLYALVIDANKSEYYVRRDATTFYARPEELAEIVGKAHAKTAPHSLLCRHRSQSMPLFGSHLAESSR